MSRFKKIKDGVIVDKSSLSIDSISYVKGEEKNSGLGYKTITGLEFEIANDMTFSIGFGLSDNDNNL